ncbi:MAG: YegS/Rv2252/BmrU family lipid kinase [Bacteroidales bacterium]
MTKIDFIINPISGTGKKSPIEKSIRDNITANPLHQIRIIYTEYAGHAFKLATAAALEGINIVVAVGGDGTVNEIASALVHTKTILAIIPCGSGNGLARSQKIPINYNKALKLIFSAEKSYLKTTDYGIINGHKFFCTCGIGFDAEISMRFSNASSRGLGTYIHESIKEYLNYKSQYYKIETDNKTYKYRAFILCCGNANQWGNEAYITPDADISDGLMDITIIRPFSPLNGLLLLFQIFNKGIKRNYRVKHLKSKNLTIIRKYEGSAHFDGEPIKLGKEITISTIHLGLTILVPIKHNKTKQLN